MAVFTGSSQTQTRANGGTGKDGVPPSFGSMSAGAMTSPGGLAGTTGVDAKLITGDRWQQINGNLTENIKNNLTTHVLEDEKWTVDGDYTMKVVGETTDTRVAGVKEFYQNESRFEYFGEHTDLHHEQDHTINPTHTFDILNAEAEAKSLDIAFKGMVIEGKGGVVDVTGAKAEAWGLSAEAWGFGVAAGHFKNEACAIDVGEIAMDEKIRGLRGRVDALEAQMGASRTVIMPIRIGICIAIHIDSPWA